MTLVSDIPSSFQLKLELQAGLCPKIRAWSKKRFAPFKGILRQEPPLSGVEGHVLDCTYDL